MAVAYTQGTATRGAAEVRRRRDEEIVDLERFARKLERYLADLDRMHEALKAGETTLPAGIILSIPWKEGTDQIAGALVNLQTVLGLVKSGAELIRQMQEEERRGW
ncbi:MAG: hypothetical protein ACM3US_10755 [Sphingomonadaceae bacterium]